MADSSSDFLRSITDACDFLDEPTCICDLCEQEGDQRPAMGFCSDCKDYLCQECYDTHLRPRPMRHHVLLDRHKMPKDQRQDKDRDTCTEACTVHPHKMLEYFCTDHGVFGCSACMTLHHRRCEGVDHIPDIAGDILDNLEYTAIQQRIASLTQLTTTAIRTSQDQVKRSQSYHTTALEAFQTFKKDMSKAIARMEKSFNADADRIKGEDVTKAQMVEDKYKQALKGFQAIGSKFVSLQTSGQFCQLFIAMKRAKREIDAIESKVIDNGQGTNVRNYRLVPSRDAQILMDSPETMVTLDIVTAADSDHGKPTHPATSATSHQTLSSRQTVTTPVPGATDSENPQHKATDTQAQQAHGKPASIPGATDSGNQHRPATDTQAQQKPAPIPGATDSGNLHRPATDSQAQQKPAPIPGATDSGNQHRPATDTQAQQKPAPIPGATDSENQHHTVTHTQAQQKPAPITGATDSENQHRPATDVHAQQAHGKPATIPGATDSENQHHPATETQAQQTHGKPTPIPGATDSENQHHPATETQAQQTHGKPTPIPGATDSENQHRPATNIQAQQTHGKPAPIPGATDSENAHRTATDTQAQRVHGKPVPSTVLPPSHQTLPCSRQKVRVPATSHQTLPSRYKVRVPDAEARISRVPLQQGRAMRNKRAHHAIDVHVGYRDDIITPSISGCVVLPGDILVLVDNNSDNVKLVDLARGKVVARLKLSGRIHDITQVSSTQVAVTSIGEQTIYFVNVGYITIWGHTLKLDRKVKVKGQCHGIAHINDNLVVSYDEPVKVEIISMEGKVLQTVVTEDKGRQLLTRPWYISVSKDQQTVYISDWGRHTVTSVDLAGRVQATYKDNKLRWPRGLTLDTADMVYVCGAGSDNVLQLTADLTEERQLLKRSDGVWQPYSLCYCEATDRLYVGMWGSDVVKVFHCDYVL